MWEIVGVQIEIEEECITNKLMKRLEALKREKQVRWCLVCSCASAPKASCSGLPLHACNIVNIYDV